MFAFFGRPHRAISTERSGDCGFHFRSPTRPPVRKDTERRNSGGRLDEGFLENAPRAVPLAAGDGAISMISALVSLSQPGVASEWCFRASRNCSCTSHAPFHQVVPPVQLPVPLGRSVLPTHPRRNPTCLTAKLAALRGDRLVPFDRKALRCL